MPKSGSLTVAMIVSEMEPFVKTGGLADVAGALPPALGKLGLKIHVFLPRYAAVRSANGAHAQISENVVVHFIENEAYFSRKGLYGESGSDYTDNLDRFSFFCRESLSILKKTGVRPDCIHAHDWQAALSIVYLREQFRDDPFFAGTKSVFTIHNLGYQGIFSKDQYPKLGLPWELFAIHGLEYYDQVNLLKGGLVFSHRLTTVSPTYAQEIQTPEQGSGLEGVLKMRSRDLVGIINGIDQEVWDPAVDQAIPHRYSESKLVLKAKNKAALQKEMGLPVSEKAFLIGMVTRLASQKGLDLLVQALPELLPTGVQLVILGSGDRPIEEALGSASKKSSSIRLRLAFDPDLAHRIYAGADAFLMPSKYEPCGLGQMIAMRYGTVPIVRATGGLKDTVREASSPQAPANGFCFEPYDYKALLGAIRRASAAYKNPAQWQGLQRVGMKTDFSWDRSAQEYKRLYEDLSKGV